MHRSTIINQLKSCEARLNAVIFIGGRLRKTRFSQFPSQPGCNHEYASGLQQGLNDEVAPVVAQAEALVLQQPTEGALDRPAVSAQARAMRPSALVDEWLDLAGPAELTVPLGIIAFVGIDGADARHDAQGGQEQPLKEQRVGHVSGGDPASHPGESVESARQ